MKRKSSIFLAVLLSCLAILGACKAPNNSSGSGDSTSTNGGQEYTGSYEGTDGAQHLVDASKLLHKVNVTESNRTFIVNQTTDYMIVLGTNNAAAVEAANFLAYGIVTDLPDHQQFGMLDRGAFAAEQGDTFQRSGSCVC